MPSGWSMTSSSSLAASCAQSGQCQYQATARLSAADRGKLQPQFTHSRACGGPSTSRPTLVGNSRDTRVCQSAWPTCRYRSASWPVLGHGDTGGSQPSDPKPEDHAVTGDASEEEGVSLVSTAQLQEVLADPQSRLDLREYYHIGQPDYVPLYSGRRFDSLGLAGHEVNDADTFTATDLLAVQCLSVTVPTEVAMDLLEGELGRRLGDLLSRIPNDLDLGTGNALAVVANGSAADQAWQLLRRQSDVSWVTAGKLLARKCSRLIPVWDNVVRCAYGRPDGAWTWLDERLRKQRAVLFHALETLHADSGLPGAVSPLRTLDVVVWMRHRKSHRKSRCQGLL
jgi:hypothetical protein